jgi:hypothetical protein
MLADRLPVTDQGVVVPRTWFGDAKEVALRQEEGHIVLEPVARLEGRSPSEQATVNRESIWSLGSDPIAGDPITDSSVNHDQYLYGIQQ